MSDSYTHTITNGTNNSIKSAHILVMNL